MTKNKKQVPMNSPEYDQRMRGVLSEVLERENRERKKAKAGSKSRK